MSGQFITNQKKFLSEVISNILPSSQKLFFLVGYFYFSGFQEVYRQIADKEVKILVGLDVEKYLGNKIREFQYINELNISRGKVKENFNRALVALFNDTDYFDSEEKQKAFRLFLAKLKEGTLEIKKTLQSNHAKLYLFENKEEYSQGGDFPGTVITGSSNLTLSGLRGRHEINVLFRDSPVYKEAKELFDSLWSNAVEIANKNNFDEFYTDVIKNIWFDKLPKPIILYARVLDEYFSCKKEQDIRTPALITNNRYFDLKYQIDAIKQALEIIRKHDGVIIADVVGLGKSIVASTIAHNLHLKSIIITPPHLKDQWNDYQYDFDFNAKLYTSGLIEEAVRENNDSQEKLIIIDEAHKYRNEMTLDYANLHKLCQGNKIILLSATPFNNRPQDIFSMIKLFQIPAKSTVKTIDSLSYSFKELVKEYKDIQKSQREQREGKKIIKKRIKNLANRIRDILFPLVIRRSRLDLDAIEKYRDDLKIQNVEFPEVEPPKSVDYKLGELSSLYIWTLDKIAPDEEQKGFLGARYKPVAYLKNFEKYKQKIEQEFGDTELFKQSQRNMALFMKRLLVRRFESSIMAFKTTLDSIIESYEKIEDYYRRIGKVPIYKKGNIPDVDALLEISGEEIEHEIDEVTFAKQLRSSNERGIQFIDKKELRVDFIDDLSKDTSLLKEIKDRWFSNRISRDPKLESFIKEIKKQLLNDPERKIIVFSEYADTVSYLYRKLKDKLRVFSYTSKKSTKKNKDIVKENFDASLSKYRQKNDYDVLVATDAISEGYNLHRAGTVFNYDIPYNPTRVIQRVGRINRVCKMIFNKLYIYNFFPTATGEEEIRTKQISTLKLAMIQALLGEDTKVLTSDEKLESFFKERYLEAQKNQEELSWDIDYINFLDRIKQTHPEIVTEARNLPKRVRIRRDKKKAKKGVIVFGKKGEEYTFKLGSSTEQVLNISPLEALDLFEAIYTEGAIPVSTKFETIYQAVRRNLFITKSEIPYDRGKAQAIDKINILIEKFPQRRDYLEDLKFVLKSLDSLPDHFSKKIRAISEENLSEQVEQLKKEIDHKYLMELREKASRIDEGEEELILAEELLPA